jgi:MoxR-like ATPase
VSEDRSVQPWLGDVAEVVRRLRQVGYLAERGLATAVYLAARLPQPLLLEGEPGVGKSELPRALAAAYDLAFLRLQCYEGLESREALYEWNYLGQLLELRRREARAEEAADLFSRRFLLARPLLSALEESKERPAVLLIDELDRADEAFEAFLLEFLADYAVTVPELGTIRAVTPPVVVITSNRTRELHDALKRRCLYHWLDYPDLATEVEIVRTRAPQVDPALVERLVRAVRALRSLELAKPPGVAESIAWARATEHLGGDAGQEEAARRTLGAVVKNRDDMARARDALEGIWRGAD